MSQPQRWVYRFDNFKRAFILLREAIEIMQEREISRLEKEGIIQRFEFTLELAWKVLKDYLEASRVVIKPVTPLTVIKEAFAAGIIDKGPIWVRALDARNLMSHTYNLEVFEQIIIDIKGTYMPMLEKMYMNFLDFEKQND